MLTKMRELCEQAWSSQLVANHHETGGDSIAYMMAYHYAIVVDWTQTWRNTPQGDDYWAIINDEWRNNH